MTHNEKALNLFWDKFNCSQAVLAAFSEELGLSEEQALNTAFCFSGGMRKGEVCGAVSGALMVIGMKNGRSRSCEADKKAKAYSNAAEFMEKFKKENGSYICRDILGCDISTDDGMQYAEEHHYFNNICPKMVESAVKILEDMQI